MDRIKNERAAGIFYTPSSIVNLMIRRIFYWLEKLKRIDVRNGEKFCRTVSLIKFCDPAVGTGNFFLGLIEYLDHVLDSYEGINLKEKNTFLHSFVTSNIFGVDLFRESVNKCKQRIVKLLPFVKENELVKVKYGNSLVDEDVYDCLNKIEAEQLYPFSWNKEFKESKFDVILGNPPYYNLKKAILSNPQAKLLFKYLKCSKYWKEHFRASSDIYYYFILRGIKLLKSGGILSFILPSYWIYNQYADRLRKVLTENTILELFDFKTAKIFRTTSK
ncbi:MAG: Eco57I restriction-modification methylase domain-containing protein, partial [Candidatus Heimdallarchaeaceae archaeon]